MVSRGSRPSAASVTSMARQQKENEATKVTRSTEKKRKRFFFFCAFCAFLWLKKYEVPVSQFISEDLHLVLARDDHYQRRAVCGVCTHASDTDSQVVARPCTDWSKRA